MDLAAAFIEEEYKHIAYLKESKNCTVETVQNHLGKVYIRRKIKDGYTLFSKLSEIGLKIYPRIFYLGCYDDTVYVIEEYLAGETLEDVLAERKEFMRCNLRKLVYNLLKSVLLLHEHGIYHGQLKLSNVVMLPDREHVQFIDFLGTNKKYLYENKKQQDIEDTVNIIGFLAQIYDDIFLQMVARDYLNPEKIEEDTLKKLCNDVSLWK